MKVLCSEQKRLQNRRKQKIKQLMKYTVQIMGMGSSRVLMAIIRLYSALFFFMIEHSLKGVSSVLSAPSVIT